MNVQAKDPVRAQVVSHCRAMLRDVVSIGLDTFGSTQLPEYRVPYWIMEPSATGWSGRKLVHAEPNMRLIWDRTLDRLKSQRSWAEAEASVQRYMDHHGFKPGGYWLAAVDESYLLPLAESYLSRVDAFVFVSGMVSRVTTEMLRFLDSQDVEIVALEILEGFQAERPFRLDRQVRLRPIEERELIMLGRTDSNLGPGSGRRPLAPRTDCWMCEIRLPNPRGTAIGWNKVHDVTDTLALALRAFKPGGVAMCLGSQHVSGPYERTMRASGSILENISRGENEYLLSATDIPKFIRFWRKFRRFTEDPNHYLHVPIRRLRVAGTRAEKQDALVDCVIGLEALLGTVDERTELGYRFRVRGSVLLSDRKVERRTHMEALKKLYRLRSSLVHGEEVSMEELQESLPLAENALRRVWNWYFRRLYNERSNRAGIDRVDRALIG